MMVSPIPYYAAAHILVTNQPKSISSWSNHLARVARPLIFILIAAGANFNLRIYLVLETINFGPIALLIYPANCGHSEEVENSRRNTCSGTLAMFIRCLCFQFTSSV
jgi:hypothetical protein